jgi:hypothetical protein
MTSIIPNGGYSAEASALDCALDLKISDIRARLDGGDITVRQAADERVAALTWHLAMVEALRNQYFGDDDAHSSDD